MTFRACQAVHKTGVCTYRIKAGHEYGVYELPCDRNENVCVERDSYVQAETDLKKKLEGCEDSIFFRCKTMKPVNGGSIIIKPVVPWWKRLIDWIF